MAKTPAKAKARRQESRKSSLPTDPPPALLEGEDEAAYQKLLAQVTAAVEPNDVIEEFWVRDVVDLAWDAIRLRRLKADLLNASLANGLEKVLSPLVSFESRALAESWYGRDKDAIKKVDRLLGQASQSMDAVMAQTFSVKLDDIERLDRMLANVEARRHLVLREIDRHRAAV